MIRKDLYIPIEQVNKLNQITYETGINFSELVRRGISMLIDHEEAKKRDALANSEE